MLTVLITLIDYALILFVSIVVYAEILGRVIDFVNWALDSIRRLPLR